MIDCAKWITTVEFAALKPVNIFHKQYADFYYVPNPDLQNKHILFRKSFKLGNFYSAFINITADDYYKLYINGQYVAQGPAPGYSFNYYYNTIEVSRYLRQGTNVIAVHTYYQGLINRVWISGDNMHGLWLELFADGEKKLVSDDSFLTAPHNGYTALHKIGYDTQFAECYDSRARECRFYLPEFDDSSWAKASIREYVPYKIFEQPAKMLEVYNLKPSLEQYGNTVRLDLQQCIVGSLWAKAKGIKGSEIKLYFADELNEDGSLRFNMRSNCLYSEKWILSGGTDELNQFDYKAFRYAELILPDGCELDAGSVYYKVRHYPYQDKSKFTTEDKKINQVINLIKNTIKYGVQEVFFDCPQREKGQYLGDGYFIGTVHSLITGDTAMFKKFLADISRSRFICPGLMAQAPGAFMQEIADFSLQYPTMLLAYYALSKDEKFLAEILPVVIGLIDYFKTFEDGDRLLRCVDKWNLVDWPANLRDGYDADLAQDANFFERKVAHNVINAFYIGALKAVNRIAKICKRPNLYNVAPYENAFIKAFYNPVDGMFKDSEKSLHQSFHANVVPLHFNIGINEKNKRNILNLIKLKRLDFCNIFGAFQTFCALKRIGEDQLILDLIKDEKYWHRMLKEGATTTFEAWGKDLKWNTALFHLALVFPFMFLEKWDINLIFA